MLNIDGETDAVAKLAYEYWEAEGRPNGRDLDHWLRAEGALFQPSKKNTRTAKKQKHASARAERSKRSAPRR